MKILITDDEFVSREKARKILSVYGDCETADSGRDALNAFIVAYDQREPYGLVFMDILMPDMDGIEALQRIRQWEDQQGIAPMEGVKVIMLTASDAPRTIINSFNKGCEAYILKPFNREKLAKAMREVGFEV